MPADAGVPLSAPGAAWVALAALSVLGSGLAWWAPAPWLDWQPALAAAEPWRAFSATFVHWSALHLAANLGAAVAVAAFGWAARLPRAAALAWAAAWPLTHLGLLWRSELAHYGGLSGVLHAGVAVAVAWLLWRGHGRRRAIGAVVGAGLALKLLLEQPWGPALRQTTDWDIAVAPLAHATGALAGLLCAAVAMALSPGAGSAESQP